MTCDCCDDWDDYGLDVCCCRRPDPPPRTVFLPALLSTGQGDVLAGPDGVTLEIYNA